MLVNLHDGGLITASVAVVRCAEDGHHISILAPIVALHDELMRSRDQCQAIIVVERLADVLTKSLASASWTDAPATSIVRITPQQITHWPLVRHFLNPVQTSNIIQCIDTRAQTSVQAKDLVVNQSGEGKVVEEISEEFPDIGVAVLAQTLVVEAVNLGDLARFMVAAQDGDAGRVADFERDEESDGFDRIIASVNVVTLT